ncbi:MAG TPA: flavin reductase family protein [Pseudonocardia sp.]|nr:flavin reductase family protein [Pseudonocardia sp.]
MGSTRTTHEFRRVLGLLPTGVVVVTGIVDGAPCGMALNSFTSVSLDPPLVSFCVARTSGTWPRLRRAQRVAVSVLSAGHEEVCRRFATPGADRFAGLVTHPAPGGAPVLAGAVAWLDGRPSAVHPAGDHDLVLVEVLALGRGDRPGQEAADPPGPLVFHAGRYLGLGAA